MSGARGVAHRVGRLLIGCAEGVATYPGRIRRGEARLPRPRDFRPTHPRNWSIGTRLLVATLLPITVVVAIDGVSGHLNPITLGVLLVAAMVADRVSRSVTRPIELVID